MRFAAWGFATLAVALAVAFGALFAGYLLAGAAFAFIAVLMGMQVGRAIDNWRLEHSWRFRRTGTRPKSGAHERRAA
jgi:hypothetical protein